MEIVLGVEERGSGVEKKNTKGEVGDEYLEKRSRVLGF